MKSQDIIKAVAELDGWSPIDLPSDTKPLEEVTYIHPHFPPITYDSLPPYLTSRDAIVPVIEKNYPDTVATALTGMLLDKYKCKVTGTMIMTATPSQLCEALLRATGKWVEE